jgi:pyrroline-5-carboxylate reductase
MGVAILSGVLASFEAESNPHSSPKWEYPDSDTVITPIGPPMEAIPSKFIACVSRAESAINLDQLFRGQRNVEVVAGANVSAIKRADVVLLW